MNKIYKVMYSKVKQCAVVVSEIAKSHSHNGESSGVRKHAALTAAVLIALGGVSFITNPEVAYADLPISNGYYLGISKADDSRTKDDNANGKGAGGTNSITIGHNSTAGTGTITIGDRRADDSKYSVYLGEHYTAANQAHPDPGSHVTSIGYDSDARGTGSIALGSGAEADVNRASEGGEKNPDADSASVAIGYQAKANKNNIAIGAGSVATAAASEDKAYLSGQDAVSSYVSVGKSDALRRISNVADGAADSDVATIGQLKKLSARAGVYNEGWGIKIGDYTKKDANGQETTVKNAISIDRNLGSNEITSKSNNTFEAAGENSLILGGAGTDDFVAINGKHREKDYGSYGKDSVLVGGENNKTTKDGTYAVISGGGQNIASGEHSFIGGGWWNTATGATSTVVGGQANTASGNQSTIVGGDSNRAIGDESSILGGNGHTAVGESSTISGGVGAYTFGSYSSVSGGQGNVAIGMTSSADGGWLNFAYGDTSQVSGGYSNYALGNYSNSLGGRNGVVQGNVSVGIAGGSTGAGAGYALAAGYQSVVTGNGVRREKSDDVYDAIMEVGKDAQGNEGYKYTDVATALGYQATANETNTVSFGHDKGDVSGYTVNWDIKYDTDDQGNIKFDEDGMPLVESIKANGITTNHYDSAKYNRLVKVADGINNHDVVVMEQLRNADNVGKNAKNNVVVYKENKDGTLQVDENGEAIIDVDASKAATEKATEQAIKDSEDAWGSALGTGKVEANNSQLVTGDTVYNAIQNQAEWKLTTNGESADKAAAIKPGTTVDFSAEKKGKDHSNVTISHEGSNVTIGLDKEIVLGDTTHGNGGSLNVYSDSSDGNNQSNHVSINGSTINVNYKNKAGNDTRGVILGVGKEDGKPDGYIAFNNVEGGYTYLHASTDASDDKKGRLEYVGNDGNKKYIANLDDVSTAVNNAKTKYYAVNGDAPIMSLADYSNAGNDGAKGEGSLAAGFVTHADGIASTVAGSYSGVINSGKAQGLDLRGAAALSYGTFNVNQNTEAKKEHSGVANSIVGQVNVTKDSNAAIIYGAGNIVTDSYRPIDEKKAADILGSTSDPKALSKAMQDAVKDSGGQVMVMGGGNSVDKAYMTQVVGVGNKVTGQDSTYAEKTSTQYNFVDGFQNELKNGKNDYIIGTKNKVSGDSVDKNQSNIIFGDNHTLTNTKNAVIIGSSDKVTEIAGSDAVSIGYNANAGGESVALGSNAVAGGNALAVGPYANAKNNSIALGIHASATSSQNLAIGYYANVTGRPDTIKNSVALGASSTVGEKDILSTDNGFGVLSIGAKDKERRIIHVRAGVNDTDAVNVSQLKSVQSGLTDKGLTFVTNDGEHIAKLGSKVTIQGTAKKADHEYTADNLTTEIDKDGNITILMDKDMSVEKLAVNGKPGTPGSIGVKGQDGQSGVGIDGKDGISIKGRDGKDGVTIKAVDGKDGTEGHIGLTGPAGTNGKDGTNAVDITVKNGYNTEAKDGKDGINGEKGVDGTSLTRVVYEDKNGEHQIATLEDGLKFKGDNGKEISKKLNNTLEIIGGAKGDLTEGNIGVNSTTDGKLKVQLAKDLTGLNSATYTTTTGEGESAKTSTTVVNANGLTINGGPSITNNGIDGGKKTITNVGSGIKAGTDGKYTVTDANNSNAANIGDVNNMVKQAVGELSDATKTNLAGKANVDASNLTAGDVTKWQDKLGNGKVESGNTGLVTGDTVFNAVDTKANRDGSNLTDKEADSFSEKIAKGEVKPGENRAVSGDAVSQAISKVTGDMNTKLDGKANTSLDNITKDGQTVIKKLSQDAVQVKGGTAITVDDNVDDKGNKTYMISANNNGKVEKDDGNLISGDTLYKEVHVDKDGTYIKSKDSATGKDMTVAQNLSALDTGLKTTSDLIHMNDKGDIQIGGSSKATKIDVSGKDSYGKTTGRVITGVVTDAQDASSAANVGYVNGVTAANTQQIYRDMNSAYGRLNNNINKAAAGSNALAALHPLDYDPDDKADFAVGYGHYRNANAAAVGAFYHPNENTMVNVGVSLGNGDPGFNAGVSFKVGRGSAGREAMSRTEMAKVINSQSKEIDALKKDNADKDKRIDALEQKMAEILAKLDKNGK